MQNDLITASVYLLMFMFGLLSLYRPILIWFIKFSNNLRGVKTEITEVTIMYHRIGGIILMIVSGFVLVLYVLK